MQISDHYRPFEKKIVIAVTNNERARLLRAEAREVEEIAVIETPETATAERASGRLADTQQDFDAIKAHRLQELYTALNDRLRAMLEHDGYEEAIVCVPEVNKGAFAEHLAPDVSKRIKEVIPKNLASMEIAHIVRILLEG